MDGDQSRHPNRAWPHGFVIITIHLSRDGTSTLSVVKRTRTGAVMVSAAWVHSSPQWRVRIRHGASQSRMPTSIAIVMICLASMAPPQKSHHTFGVAACSPLRRISGSTCESTGSLQSCSFQSFSTRRQTWGYSRLKRRPKPSCLKKRNGRRPKRPPSALLQFHAVEWIELAVLLFQRRSEQVDVAYSHR